MSAPSDSPLGAVVAASRAGRAVALPAIRTIHPEVIEAALRLAAALGRPLAVETSANQANAEGGYGGLSPAEAVAQAQRLADRAGLDRAGLVLAADRIGPGPWLALPPEEAMARAEATARLYARAGVRRLHLDAAAGCAGEPARLPVETIVARVERLARAALDAAPEPPLLVVGTDLADAPRDGATRATDPAEARATLDAHWDALAPLAPIGGLVVRPGLGFGALAVHPLPDADPGLRDAVAHRPGVVLAARSTDYQPADAHRRLAARGFAFQSVGPALTFAWREAAYALDRLAQVAGWIERDLGEAMESLMLADPAPWQRHLDPAAGEIRLQRHFSYADRMRHYWPRPEAQAALGRLRGALGTRRLPDAMLRQGFPPAVLDRAEGLRAVLPAPDALLQAAVQVALAPLFLAEAA